MNESNYEGRSHSTRRANQNTRSSSKEAFASSDFRTDEAELMAYVEQYGSRLTRLMIETHTRFKANQVTQHVSTLIKKGKLLESKTKGRCPISGRMKYWIKSAELHNRQLKLSEHG